MTIVAKFQCLSNRIRDKKLGYRWQMRDAFRGQSRSPNMLPFHMIGMVYY